MLQTAGLPGALAVGKVLQKMRMVSDQHVPALVHVISSAKYLYLRDLEPAGRVVVSHGEGIPHDHAEMRHFGP